MLSEYQQQAGGRNDEPVFARTFGDRCIFNSLPAEEGVLVILGLSEDTRPRGALLQMTRLHDLESTSAASI